MRILRILTRLNLGGPARQALAADTLLRRRGHEIRLLAGRPEPGEGELFGEFVRRGHDVVRLPSLRRGIAPTRDLLALRAIKRQIAGFAPELVHTHASKAGALGRRALRGPAHGSLARVHTFHGHVLEGYFPPPVSRRLTAVERRLARETDRIVAVSHRTADDLIRLGVAPEERIQVIHTPGHSPGSVCFHAERAELLFSGDTLFRMGVGRTDLWGGSYPPLMESIRSRILSLPGSTRVIPGHGPETTVGAEMQANPFLHMQ